MSDVDDVKNGMREVTIEEAMSIAILFQKNGQLEDAETIYRRITSAVPDHPDALHYSGVLAHQQGRNDEAVALIQRSLELNPDQPDGYSNLGIILKACGRLDEAVDAYRQAIALDPHHANAYSNLGVVLKQRGQFVQAEEAYRAAIRLDAEHVDAYHNLGTLLARLKRTKEAVECYCRVTTLSPRHPEARRLLALAHCLLGETDKAARIFEEWLEQEPDNPVARHMLAACSGRDVPARASDAYVEKVFDDFAPSFENKLRDLSYRAPSLVTATLADAGADPVKALDILDLGCGTGLCGPLLAPYARQLVGVDLSGRMLDFAREKQVYDELVKAELTAYLRECDRRFDVIVSADTLVYVGVLDEACSAAAAALRPGGRLIFTVEELAAGDPAVGFCIRMHGRYQHQRAYIERVLGDAGLQAQIVAAELRMEGGSPVSGLVVCATKPAEECALTHSVRGERAGGIGVAGDSDA